MISKLEITCPEDLGFLRPMIVEEVCRVGNRSDGGYVMSRKVIEKSEVLLSLGLGENWSFEKAFSEINEKALIDIYDHTVSLHFFAIKLVKGIVKFILLRESFSNVLARGNRLKNYFMFWVINSKNKHHRIRIGEASLSMALSRYTNSDLIGLKVDIEGSEWEILNLIVRNKDRFQFLLIEIHDFDKHVDQLRDFLGELSGNFVLAHLHANNFETLGSNGFPKVFEITLLRSPGTPTSAGYRSELPIPGLDVPNAKNRPDFLIKFQ
jgi:hypothetical protein